MVASAKDLRKLFLLEFLAVYVTMASAGALASGRESDSFSELMNLRSIPGLVSKKPNKWELVCLKPV